MFGGAALGVFALIISLASAYVLYRVADEAQKALETFTGNLSLQIAHQKTLTAQALERAAEATGKAESERLERLKLEAAILPRGLDLENQKAVVKALSRFAGRRVVVSSWAADAEALILAQQTVSILTEAKLIPVDAVATLASMGGITVGVHVGGSLAPLVAAIIASLQGKLTAVEDSNIARMVTTAPGIAGVADADAVIFIGTKPALTR